MKFYAVVALLLLFVVLNASADWRSDMKKSRWEKMFRYIKETINGVQSIRLSNSLMRNAPSDVSYGCDRLQSLLPIYKQDIDSCIRSADNAREAKVCCDRVDSNIANEAMNIFRRAT